MSKNILILFIALILNSCTNGQTKQEQSSLSAVEFSEKINATEQPLIVDVRTPEEFKQGHLKNALNLNWNGSEFGKQLATLDKTQPVFVYCLSGGRSSSAANKMRKEGFEKVFEMHGGMMEWRANNLPEIKANTTEKGMSLEQYQNSLNSDKLVLVDFYAEWCAPCKKMEPYLEKIADEMADQVTVIRIDADKNAELCKTLNVSALPVLKLYKSNKKIWQNTGYVGENEVREQIQINKNN